MHNSCRQSCGAGDEGERNQARRQHSDTMTSHELLCSIDAAWRASQDRFLSRVAPEVISQSSGALVALLAVLGQCLERDPVQVTADASRQSPWFDAPPRCDIAE